MNTISRTAKILDRVCGVIYWLLLVCIVFFLFAAVLLIITAIHGMENPLPSQSITLSLGAVELLLAPDVLPQIVREGIVPWFIGAILLAAASLPIYFLMLLTVRGVLKPFINREPFHETVAAGLKRLSILVVVDTALNAIAVGLMDHLTRNYLDLSRLFVGDLVVSAGFSNSDIDMMPLLFAGALYLLSKVFLYGQELQTLSDETL